MKNSDRLYDWLQRKFFYFHRAIVEQNFEEAADLRDEIKAKLEKLCHKNTQ